jgi:hypothetical protein
MLPFLVPIPFRTLLAFFWLFVPEPVSLAISVGVLAGGAAAGVLEAGSFFWRRLPPRVKVPKLMTTGHLDPVRR